METEDTCLGLESTERTNAGNSEAAATVVDNCPERMDAADAEAPGPPRNETAVEF